MRKCLINYAIAKIQIDRYVYGSYLMHLPFAWDGKQVALQRGGKNLQKTNQRYLMKASSIYPEEFEQQNREGLWRMTQHLSRWSWHKWNGSHKLRIHGRLADMTLVIDHIITCCNLQSGFGSLSLQNFASFKQMPGHFVHFNFARYNHSKDAFNDLTGAMYFLTIHANIFLMTPRTNTSGCSD